LAHCFFFQAEDGIRGFHVTGVQTCALPIFSLDWVELSWRVREGSPNPGGLARYPLKAVIPIGFMLLFLQGVSHLIKAVAFLTGHRERLFDLAAGVEEKRI